MKAGVVGASGYLGAELLRLLAGHPGLEVVVAQADSSARYASRRPLPEPRTRLRRISPLRLLTRQAATGSMLSSWLCLGRSQESSRTSSTGRLS